VNECLIVSLEDVLAMDANNAWARNVDLYGALGGTFRTVVITRWDREEAKRWMRAERVRYDLLLERGNSILNDHEWKLHAVTEVQAMGWPIGVYLDSDPGVVQEVLARGITTLLISFRVARPNWVPVVGAPRAWDDLVAFIDDQREANGVSGEVVDEVGGGRRSRWPGEVQADVG
jgi:hypothetical protein